MTIVRDKVNHKGERTSANDKVKDKVTAREKRKDKGKKRKGGD